MSPNPGFVSAAGPSAPAVDKPTSIPGLMVWYSADYESTQYADGAEITVTHDLSGNNNHGGIYNGEPKMRYTGGPGNAKFIDCSNAVSGNDSGTVQLPTNLMSGVTAAEALWVTKHNVGDQKGFGLWGPSTSDFMAFSDNNIYVSFGSTARHSTGVSMDANWRRYRMLAKTHATDGFKVWKDGVLQPYTAGNTVAWSTTPRIGEGSGNRWLWGFGLFVLYNRELTAGERTTLETFATLNPNGGMP